MRNIILIGLLLVASVSATEFNATKYEMDVFEASKHLDISRTKNIEKCKTFAKRGQRYLKYIDDNNISDAYSRATIENCRRNIAHFCGGIMSTPRNN